jgi:hypothetical protein
MAPTYPVTVTTKAAPKTTFAVAPSAIRAFLPDICIISEATETKHDRTVSVIPPLSTGCILRVYAAIFNFIAGVMPPMPMLGRSLLYVHNHSVA